MHFRLRPLTPAKVMAILTPDGDRIARLRTRAGMTQADLAALSGYAKRTIERLESGSKTQAATLKDVAEALRVDIDELMADEKPATEKSPGEFGSTPASMGNSPSSLTFFGRDLELGQLSFNLHDANTRVILVHGVRGVGKTLLCSRWVHEQVLQDPTDDHFDCVIWRSALVPRPFSEFVEELTFTIRQLCADREIATHSSPLDELRALLQRNRCLIVIDNLDRLLKEGEVSGEFLDDYADYEQAFVQLGCSEHRSKLLLTSTERLRCIDLLPFGRGAASAELRGLSLEDGLAFVEYISTSGLVDRESWTRLLEVYGRNPLAIRLAVSWIEDAFGGNHEEFFAEGQAVVPEVADLFQWHFDRLSDSERHVAFRLALEQTPVSVEGIQRNSHREREGRVRDAVASLRRRNLLDWHDGLVGLHPLFAEIVLEFLLQASVEEILRGKLSILRDQPLTSVNSPMYVQAWQRSHVMAPIVDRLNARCGDAEKLLRNSLEQLKASPSSAYGNFGGGNVLNLLFETDADLSNLDASNLPLWNIVLPAHRLIGATFTHSELRDFRCLQPMGGLISMALRADGGLLAVGDTNGVVHIFQTEPWRCLHRFRGHFCWAKALEFVDAEDLLLTGGADGKLRVWDSPTGSLAASIEAHRDWIWSITHIPELDAVLSVSDDRTAKLWSMSDCEPLATLEVGDSRIRAAAVSRARSEIAVGREDGSIWLFDARMGSRCGTLDQHDCWIWSMAISPSGRYMASGDEGSRIVIWDLASREPIDDFRQQHGIVTTLAFSGDDSHLLVGVSDGGLSARRLTGVPESIPLKGRQAWPWGSAFHKTSNELYTVGEDRTIRTWSAGQFHCLRRSEGYSNWVRAVQFMPNDQTVLAGSEDGYVREWNLASRSVERTFSHHEGSVWTTRVSRCGKYVASSGEDGVVLVWDSENRRLLHRFEAETGRVWSLDFSACSTILATAGADGDIRLWDLRRGMLFQRIQGHSARAWAVRFSPDGSSLVSTGVDGLVLLCDVADSSRSQRLRQHAARVLSVSFNGDGSLFASAGADHRVVLWQRDGTKVGEIQTRGESVWHIEFSPCGMVLYGGTDSGAVVIWDLGTLSESHRVLAHDGWVRTLSPAASRHLLVSGGTDGNMHLWNTDNWKKVATLRYTRPYEGLVIRDTRGLTEGEKDMLTELGAVR